MGIVFIFSCQKIDKIGPVVETLSVNGIFEDTIYLAPLEIYVEYEVTDDELVVDTRIRIIELANPDSGFFYLDITRANSDYFKGSNKLSIPDSILQVSKLYSLTIDAYDPSGNQAIQKKSLLHFK